MKRLLALLIAAVAVVTTTLPAAAPASAKEDWGLLEPAALRITTVTPDTALLSVIVRHYDCVMPGAVTIRVTNDPVDMLIQGRVPDDDCDPPTLGYWRVNTTITSAQAEGLIAWFGADYYTPGVGPSWWDACPRDGARCNAAVNRPDPVDPKACRVVAAKQIDTYPSTKGLVALVRLTVKGGPCTRKVGPHRFWMAHELAATVPGDELRVFGDFDRAPTKSVIVFRYRLRSTPSLTWPGGTTLRLRDTR